MMSGFNWVRFNLALIRHNYLQLVQVLRQIHRCRQCSWFISRIVAIQILDLQACTILETIRHALMLLHLAADLAPCRLAGKVQ